MSELGGSEGVPGASSGTFMQEGAVGELCCSAEELRKSAGCAASERDRISSETRQLQEPWTPTAVQTWAESVTRRTASGKPVEGNGWKLVSSGTMCKAPAPPEVHHPQS